MNIRFSFAICAALVCFAPLAAQNISRNDYIERYKDIAVAHAEKYGIPASIKMAQGILESGNGNGTLAREGNTHFNIKVKPSDKWKGAVVYHDDDRPNEPFRAYGTPEESWVDHSEYLDTQPRYDSLFAYGVTDYRSWARGLKNAGYATDPLYAEKLVRIIEENRLYLLDQGVVWVAENASAPAVSPTVSADATRISGEVDVDNYTIAMYHAGGRELHRTDHGRFITAHEGDKLTDISALTGVRVGRLARLNRIDKNAALSAGQQIKIE